MLKKTKFLRCLLYLLGNVHVIASPEIWRLGHVPPLLSHPFAYALGLEWSTSPLMLGKH